jgi:hypothetical protein
MAHGSRSQTIPPQRISEIEWNMEVTLKGVPPWQLIAMLNYEYARSYEPILEAVDQLRNLNKAVQAARKSSPQNTHPPFAEYLVRDFPEFPHTPWVKIDPEERLKRLSKVNINEKNGLYEPRQPAWKAWELGGEKASLVARQWANWPENIRELYGAFVLDFLQTDEEIIKQFSEWVTQRRKALIKKYDHPIKLNDGSELNDNVIFNPRKGPNLPKGHGHKQRKCEESLKALGWWRIWELSSCNLDNVYRALKSSGRSASSSQDRNFSEQKFYRAKVRVGQTMLNLAARWNQFSFPNDIIEDPRVVQHPTPGTTDHIMDKEKKLNKAEKNEARKFLADNFTTVAIRLNGDKRTR